MYPNATVPLYNFTSFETQEDLFAYIENEQYTNASAGFEGVCFGYQITSLGEHSYETRLFFNDQTSMGGIPSQL